MYSEPHFVFSWKSRSKIENQEKGPVISTKQIRQKAGVDLIGSPEYHPISKTEARFMAPRLIPAPVIWCTGELLVTTLF